MKLNISIVCIAVCVFLWLAHYAQCSISCVRAFLGQESSRNLVLVDQKSDLPLETFFDTANWIISTDTMPVSIVIHPKSAIVITTSVAEIRISSVNFEKRRVYVVLNDFCPSSDVIWNVFSEFNENMRSKVVVIVRATRNLWNFYRFIKQGVAKKGGESVEMFAECDDADGNRKVTLLKNPADSRRRCPLVIAVTNFEPFTYYDKSRGFYKGIDYSLVENIAKQLKVDVKFVPADVDSIKCVFLKF